MISEYQRVMKRMYKEADNHYKIKLVKKNIKRIIQQGEQIRKDHTELDSSQIRDILRKDFEEFMMKYSERGNSLLKRYVQYFSIEYLLCNKDIARKLFDEYKDNTSVERVKEECPFEINKTSKLMIREVVRLMNINKINKNYDSLYNYLNSLKKNFKDILAQHNINILIMIGKFFKKYDLLYVYNSDYNRNMKSAGVQGLNYQVKGNKKKKGNTQLYIEDVFSDRYLKGLDFHTLMTVAIFWQNRMAKDFKRVCTSFYIIDKLDLLKNNTTLSDIDKIPMKKMQELIARKSFVNRLALLNLRDPEFGLNDEYMSSRMKKYCNEYKEQYHTNLKSEVSVVEREQVNNENIYLLKHDCIANLIKMLINDKSEIVNWGIIPEKSDSAISLICIDIPGYNMPVSLHIPTDSLIYKLNTLDKIKSKNENDYMIPIYAGEYDFEINGSHIPTNILMPMTYEQKKSLKSQVFNAKKTDRNYKLLQHLFANSNGEIPLHLKETEPRSSRQFYDLIEGKIYIKDKRGKYVEYDGGFIGERR